MGYAWKLGVSCWERASQCTCTRRWWSCTRWPRVQEHSWNLTPENKQIILETNNCSLADCTVQWLNMLNKDLQQRLVDRVALTVKEEEEQEEEEEEEEEEEREVEEEDSAQVQREEPMVPPPQKVSIEVQTDPSHLSDEHGGSSRGRGTSIFCRLSKERGNRRRKERHQCWWYCSKTETCNLDILWRGHVWEWIKFILRKLGRCFPDGSHGEGAGFYNQGYPTLTKQHHMFWHMKFYNQGYPALTKQRHMFWHMKYRKTNRPYRLLVWRFGGKPPEWICQQTLWWVSLGCSWSTSSGYCLWMLRPKTPYPWACEYEQAHRWIWETPSRRLCELEGHHCRLHEASCLYPLLCDSSSTCHEIFGSWFTWHYLRRRGLSL